MCVNDVIDVTPLRAYGGDNPYVCTQYEKWSVAMLLGCALHGFPGSDDFKYFPRYLAKIFVSSNYFRICNE